MKCAALPFGLDGEWHTPREILIDYGPLHALVRKGYAERKKRHTVECPWPHKACVCQGSYLYRIRQ